MGEATTTSYDNGVWNYDYKVTAVKDNQDIVLDTITTTSAKASKAQWGAQDSNKMLAGAARTLFAADETLMERMGDMRYQSAGDDGVWAKYMGGKITTAGVNGDNDFKYNGLAIGYDRPVGKNWRVGVAGQYAKGDTNLSSGLGEVKSAAGAIYGTWLGESGHHLDLVAKVGKVDSESKVYGGSIAQQLRGDYSSTAMSLSAEYGYRKQLRDNWFVEPVVHASYMHLGGDDYTVKAQDTTMKVSNDGMNSFILRGGVLLGKNFAKSSNAYMKLGLLHDFSGDITTHITADGRSVSYNDSIGGTGFEYGLGINHYFTDVSRLYMDVERISGGDVTKNWGVNLGFRYSF